MRKHVRVDMPVLESIGNSTAGSVRRLLVEADAVEGADGELTLALNTLRLRISENGDVAADGPWLIVTDIETPKK